MRLSWAGLLLGLLATGLSLTRDTPLPTPWQVLRRAAQPAPGGRVKAVHIILYAPAPPEVPARTRCQALARALSLPRPCRLQQGTGEERATNQAAELRIEVERVIPPALAHPAAWAVLQAHARTFSQGESLVRRLRAAAGAQAPWSLALSALAWYPGRRPSLPLQALRAAGAQVLLHAAGPARAVAFGWDPRLGEAVWQAGYRLNLQAVAVYRARGGGRSPGTLLAVGWPLLVPRDIP